jgi:ribosomal protein L30/L7E
VLKKLGLNFMGDTVFVNDLAEIDTYFETHVT